MSNEKMIKVLLGKVGLDGHDRGVRVVASWLRDAGMEVVYVGRFLTPDNVAESAIEEDVDVIGLSFLAADHIFMCREMLEKMKERNLEVPLIVGGVIPKDDIARLKEMGVSGVFTPGTHVDEVVGTIKQVVGT